MHRKDILTNAITHTCGDREAEYGSPTDNLTDCARLWEAYLQGRYGDCDKFTIRAEDVAWLNVLQKIARTFNGTASADTYEDAAAYAAIAGECAIEPTKINLGDLQEKIKCPACGKLHRRMDNCACGKTVAV